MTLLNRKQILDVSDIKTQDVDVPEWGGTVRVRGMSGTERSKYEDTYIRIWDKVSIDLSHAREQLVSMTAIDEKGELLFTQEDVIALGEKSASGLERVYQVARRLSGLTKADMEELAKNSISAPSGASTST
jgi:hypothetical protein